MSQHHLSILGGKFVMDINEQVEIKKIFIEKMKRAAYKYGFCPNDQWMLNVIHDLFESFEIKIKGDFS